MIKFLELKKITDRYSSEIHEAVSRVIDSGWYLQGKENEKFEADYSTYIKVHGRLRKWFGCLDLDIPCLCGDGDDEAG